MSIVLVKGHFETLKVYLLKMVYVVYKSTIEFFEKVERSKGCRLYENMPAIPKLIKSELVEAKPV